VCGILAMIGSRHADAFDDALDTLTSRGPDARGIWRDPDFPVTLGHRRLSIIDLEGGVQPMPGADDRFVLTYNGELYNYRALRDELEQAGHRFVTQSDTEVLLRALIAWGVDALPRFDGMFAFALWDRHERTLLAARDRFGIKPLVYAPTPDGLVLGSTLAPFFKLPGFPRKLNAEALREYLATQSIPAPLTILQDVHALPPANWLRWSADTSRIEAGRYWELPGPTEVPMDVDALIDATDTALRESVRRQMVADVPLGAFLSGGIDSSLMVHYMAEASSQPVRTFSVRFAEKDEYDESSIAQQVAQQLGCEHHEFDAADIDAPAFLDAVTQLDQPLGDPAYLPTLALARLTRQHVTVAISGDGGDEVFGGYDRFLRGEAEYPTPGVWSALDRLGLLPGALRRRALGGAERLLWERVKLGPFAGTRKDMAALLTPEVESTARVEDTMRHWLELARAYARPIDTDALIRADAWTYLSDNCLIKTDRASMAHSLEVRVPLLGNPVVDLVMPQPASVKLARGLKTPLHALAQRHLPAAVWDRPKHGFSVPLLDYFRGPWRRACNELVHDAASLGPCLNTAHVQTRWHKTLAGRDDTRTMYTLLVLLAWLREHRVDF
jgi:asparagine synthase (glutamine-hydrolysing)